MMVICLHAFYTQNYEDLSMPDEDFLFNKYKKPHVAKIKRGITASIRC